MNPKDQLVSDRRLTCKRLRTWGSFLGNIDLVCGVAAQLRGGLILNLLHGSNKLHKRTATITTTITTSRYAITSCWRCILNDSSTTSGLSLRLEAQPKVATGRATFDVRHLSLRSKSSGGEANREEYVQVEPSASLNNRINQVSSTSPAEIQSPRTLCSR